MKHLLSNMNQLIAKYLNSKIFNRLFLYEENNDIMAKILIFLKCDGLSHFRMYFANV